MSDTPPDPHDDYPEDWETFYEDGDAYGRDGQGSEFKLDAGSPEKVADRCNAPLRDYQRRYGEIRYCTQYPCSHFEPDDVDASDYCQHHRYMSETPIGTGVFKHGYFGRSYVNFARDLAPTEFLLAVEMFDELLGMSQYEFGAEHERISLDTSESLFVAEDEVGLDLPIPQSRTNQAHRLWMAALDEVKLQRMQEAIIEQGVSKQSVVDSADADGQITDTLTESKEHHLNLPVSRLTKDIKEHLKAGGVEVGQDEDATVTVKSAEWTTSLDAPEEDSATVEDVSEEISERLDESDEDPLLDPE